MATCAYWRWSIVSMHGGGRAGPKVSMLKLRLVCTLVASRPSCFYWHILLCTTPASSRFLSDGSIEEIGDNSILAEGI